MELAYEPILKVSSKVFNSVSRMKSMIRRSNIPYPLILIVILHACGLVYGCTSFDPSHFQNLINYIAMAGLVIGVGVSAFCGAVHYMFYVRQKDSIQDWKIQPRKFPGKDQEFLAYRAFFGTALLTSVLYGIIVCYVMNEGPLSKVYFSLRCQPLWWMILQYPLIMLYQDYAHYWLHRFYHTPFMYEKFHKLHHQFKQPIIFAATVTHPVETIHFILLQLLPAFIIPVHWVTLAVIQVNLGYHTLVGHTGIKIKSPRWMFWQPDSVFHDNHHQHTSVNYGLHSWYWDALHGTCRQIWIDLDPKDSRNTREIS